MKPVLLQVLVICSLPGSAFCQEQEGEELLIELQRARQEENSLRKQLKLTRQRIQLLTEIQNAQKNLETLDEKIARAEEAGDDDRLEQLEKTGVTLDRDIERLESQHGVLELHIEILQQTVHVPPDDRSLQGDTKKLLAMVRERGALDERLFEAYAADQEDDATRIEEAIEELNESIEHKRELLRLRIELRHARHEGDADWAEEIENELHDFGAEPDSEEHDSDDGEQRESRRRREAFNASSMPAPVTIPAAEVTRTGQLSFQDRILPLLKSACFSCHDNSGAAGDLNLESLVQIQPLVRNRRHWVNVIQQLKVRSMPPGDADQPSEEDRRTMTAWLTDAIENFDYTKVKQPGYEPARRLTHDEYNHTVRDLVGIDVRPADRFPADMTATSGFDNSANTLFVQPVLLERYLGAAELIADAAWPEKPATRNERTAWAMLLGDHGDLSNPESVRIVITNFCRRAWRRPVTPEDVTGLIRLFQSRVQAGISHRRALREVLEVVLVSPAFLMRTEADRNTTGAFRVSDWELANRLSYFLWASMPDQELFDLAGKGQLSNRTVLAAQVHRMLDDPKSETLGSVFGAQWLGFSALDRVQRDQIDHPWATDTLVTAMQGESASLLNSIVRDNAPLDRLIDADYTFLNEELAKHYRMPGVSGAHLRRVSLSDSPRRGILGHGSILAITSFPGRTSPVVRGNWILTNLLGTPPPPPPPNVSQFDEEVAEDDDLTQRQKLEMHRGNPNCYGCHSHIDPLGFALEEFEWFGRHRPRRDGHAVDTSAKLPGGRSFKGLDGLCDALAAERIPDLTVQATRKMLSYALGRQLEYYDEATVRDIVQAVNRNDRRIRSLIEAIVLSETFTMKQKPQTQAVTSPSRGNGRVEKQRRTADG